MFYQEIRRHLKERKPQPPFDRSTEEVDGETGDVDTGDEEELGESEDDEENVGTEDDDYTREITTTERSVSVPVTINNRRNKVKDNDHIRNNTNTQRKNDSPRTINNDQEKVVSHKKNNGKQPFHPDNNRYDYENKSSPNRHRHHHEFPSLNVKDEEISSTQEVTTKATPIVKEYVSL